MKLNNTNSLGNRLKSLRNIKGLSQRQLAKILNVAPSTLAMYELDKREPDYETLKKIADFFEVTTDFLLGRSNDPNLFNRDKIAEGNSNYKVQDLPEEAKKTLEEFIDYIHSKYSKGKKRE
jgi:transcriptional regulator with XRE-family HTH domain